MENAVKAIYGGIVHVKYHFRQLVKSLAVPFVLLIFLVSDVLIPGINTGDLFIIEFAQWIPLTLIAITTHRTILEGPDSVPEWGIKKFGYSEFKFVFYEIGIVLLSLPFAFIGLMIPDIGKYLAMLIIEYVFSRLSLVFPSIAIDKSIDLKASWVYTKDHQVMMFSSVIIFPFVLTGIEEVLAMIPGLFWISGVLSAVTIVFTVSALSVSYKIIQDECESAF